MDKQTIIDKIKKCLALSTSSNEHEAAIALSQARKLMEAHGITGLDIDAAAASERKAKSGATTRPANWETALAVKVGDAFGCTVIFCGGWWNKAGEWCFIGCGTAPEIAQYAFTVLHRQAKRARDEHIKTKLKRCKTATKTRRADLFSEAWVFAVTGKIAKFASNEEQKVSIDAYMLKHHPDLRDLKARDRNEGRNLRDHEYGDVDAGRRAGKDAQLNRGVGGADQFTAIGA